MVLSVQDEGVYFDNIWAYDGDTFAPDFDAYLWNWDGYADPGQSLTCFTSGADRGLERVRLVQRGVRQA